jgi:prolipoprotein diacylglyceryltransferase
MDTRIIFIFTTVYVICIISLFLIGFFVGRKIAKSREEIKELEKEKTILKGVLATARVQRQDIQDGIDRCSVLLKGI